MSTLRTLLSVVDEGEPDERSYTVTNHLPATGITRCQRAFFYVFALAPPVLVTVLVLIAGAGAVLRSGNRFDLVLNTLAAVFVLELDDIFYRILVPKSSRNLTSGLPPLNRQDKTLTAGAGQAVSGCGFVLMTIWPWWIAIIVVVIDIPLYKAWC